MSPFLLLLYFLFVHIILLIPGYTIIKKLAIFKHNQGLILLTSYVTSILILAVGSIFYYILNLPLFLVQIIFIILIVATLVLFIKEKFYKDILDVSYPIAILVVMSFFSLILISLSQGNPRHIIPDPQQMDNRNYNVLNVKVLNLANTNANDNYIPYRQAQFIINRSDPARDSFIDEWGVHFFQRTPLMGAVTASFFIIQNDRPPIAYSWDLSAKDPSQTYLKFQIIAQILNSLFVIPAFYIFKKLFNLRTAIVGALFIAISQFYIYNSFFSWPKSFVAFFILLSWLLILEGKTKYVLYAGIASGIAYLTHDLAILYIGASSLVLIISRRFKDFLIFCISCFALMLPWVITSSYIYKKISTFYLYPFSIHGIPQAEKSKETIAEFFSTPITKIISIKIESLIFLLTPYQLIFKDTLQSYADRLWAVGIFSIPGGIGGGLIIPTAWGLFKKMRMKISILVFIFVPILLSVLFIGYPKGLGALHFAEASIAIAIGVGTYFLVNLKYYFWLILAFTLNIFQLIYFTLFTYNFSIDIWTKTPTDIFKILFLLFIVCLSYVFLLKLRDKKFFASVEKTCA